MYNITQSENVGFTDIIGMGLLNLIQDFFVWKEYCILILEILYFL